MANRVLTLFSITDLVNRYRDDNGITMAVNVSLREADVPLRGLPFVLRIGVKETGLGTSDLVLSDKDFTDKFIHPLMQAQIRTPWTDPLLAPRDIVTEITVQRGKTYGPFLHNAIVGQALRDAMRRLPDPDNEGLGWNQLPFDVREGLDYIAGKISRIVTGDPEYLDNWDDIGGFAKIVADRIRKSKGL